jgi:uroporphyrinogen III methyltransferase/synthase
MSGLASRTVLVTRRREQAAAMCAALEARGARAIAMPAIAVEPVSEPATRAALAALDRYDWIVFTSVNAVECFWDCLAAAGGPVIPASVRIAAVGPATAAAVADRGAQVAAMPDTYRGDRIAEALGPLAGRRVLLPQSAIAREGTGAAMREAGAHVDEVVVYRTVSAPWTPGMLEMLDTPIDAVTFTSPSTVRGFLEAGGAAAQRVLQRAAIACIGPTTADAILARGLPVAVQPAEHTVAALVDALDDFFSAAPAAESDGRS